MLSAFARIPLLVTLGAALVMAADAPDLPAELSLSQALNLALANSTNIRIAQSRLEQASGRNRQAVAELLPQLNVHARQSYQTINLQGIGIEIPGVPSLKGKIGPFGSMDARVYLQQDLLNIANLQSWKSFRSRRESSRLLVDNSREVVALNVVATYLTALRAKATRDTLAGQVKLAGDLHQLTRDRVSHGVAPELDANRAKQQVNSLEQQRQEAEQDYVAAKLALANVLQARVTANFEVADEAAYGAGSAPDRDATLKTALASRADYRSLELNVHAAELQVRSVKSTRLPTVRMTFDDGQSGNTPVHNVNTYRVMGGIDMPIYTGGRIRGEIEEAEGTLREARANLDQSRTQIEADVLTAISGVEWAQKEVETSAANAQLSRQEVELTRSRFGQGVSDNTEVVNAQDRLTRADDARIRALFTLGVARANLARATGAAEKTYRR